MSWLTRGDDAELLAGAAKFLMAGVVWWEWGLALCGNQEREGGDVAGLVSLVVGRTWSGPTIAKSQVCPKYLPSFSTISAPLIMVDTGFNSVCCREWS